MAKISESKGRTDENSGYVRVVGVPALGQLLSRVQATVIRNGNELEAILKKMCPLYSKDANLDEIILKVDKTQTIQVFFSYKHFREGEKSIVGDVTVLDHQEQIVHVVELKDGDTFDTKKSSGELASILILSDALSRKLGYLSKTHFCAFNQSDKMAIVKGAKGRFDAEEAMTGQELCDLIKVDYSAVRQARRIDETENFEFLMSELMNIPEVRTRLEQLLEHSQNAE